MHSPQNFPSFIPRRWWFVIPIALFALLLAHGMALIFRIQPAVSLWFPPSGVAIALTLWFGPIGAVLTGVASILVAPLWGNDGWTSLLGCTDATEPLVAWWLYRRHFAGNLFLAQVRDAAAFIFSAPLAACATSAIVGSISLVAVGKMPLSNLAANIPHWWLGNAIGTLAIAPTALLIFTPILNNRNWLSSKEPKPSSPLTCRFSLDHLPEASAILVFMLGTAALTVSKTSSGGFAFQQFSFLSFIPVLWAAIRFGVTGGMLTSSFGVLVTLIAYLITYPHALSLQSFPVPAEVLHVHKLSLLVQAAVSLFVGCAITERTVTTVALAVERVKAQEHQARAQLSEQLLQLNSTLGEVNLRLEESHQEKDDLLKREKLARAEVEALLEDLRHKEDELKLITDAVPALIAFVDTDGCYRFNNRTYEEWFGQSPSQIYGRHIREVLGEAVWLRLRPHVEAALAGESVSFENQMPYQSEGTRYVMTTYIPRYSEQGQMMGFVALASDITDWKESEKELRESEQRFSTLFNGMDDYVLVYHLTADHKPGQLIEVNEQACQKLGYTREELLKMSVVDIIGSVSIDPEEKVRQLLEAKHIVVESVHLTKDGRLLPIEVNATLFTLNNRLTVQSICRDITERKKAETERDRLLACEREARAQAETANRIKDEFLAVLSHELRTPLNPILGWSKLLRSRKCDPATTERALETIERNAKLQTQLIEDLLDVSRILQGKLSLNVSPVNLVSVVEAAIETVALAAQAKSIEIKTAFDPNVGQVSGDPNRLQQVVWNLLSNAVKFTPQGGQVEVQLSSSSEAILSPDLNSSPSALSPQPSALIKVSDTGIGIDPAFLPHVFDYFRQEDSTTTRRFGGLGVGLAIVRHLVELHGGRVWASSLGEGQGATFTVALPLMNLKPQSPKNHSLLNDFPKLEGVRVVVVDDEVDTLELLQFILKQYGAQVKAVASGAEVLEVLASWKPDILVSDIGMPNFDGYMLIQQIRSLSPEQGGAIAAIALTAYAGEADTEKIVNAGFQGHITKPVEVGTLITAIAQLVRGER